MDKDNNKKGIIIPSKSISYDSFFDINNNVYVYKKVEKVSNVIYFIQDNFNDNKDLKDSILRTSREIISYASCLIRTDRINRTFIDGLVQSLLELSSLLLLSNTSNYLTDMNNSILQKEIHHIIGYIKNKILLSQPSIIMTSDMFSAPVQNSRNDQRAVDNSKGDSLSNKRNITEKPEISIQDTNRFYRTHNDMSYRDKSLKDINEKPIQDKVRKARNQDKMDDRKKQIISIIKVDKNVSIGQISSKMPDCSSKTIQRMLAELVEINVLKKEGKLKWSRYSLK